MHRYRIQGYMVASDVALPGLREARLEMANLFLIHETSDRHEELMDGPLIRRVAGPANSMILELHGTVQDFSVHNYMGMYARVDLEDRTVSCYFPDPHAHDAIDHFLLDHVFPMIATSERHLVVHASVVCPPHSPHAVAFVGTTGAGKSTMASLMAQHGWDILCDDICQVRPKDGGIRVVPHFHGVRLNPDNPLAMACPPPPNMPPIRTKRLIMQDRITPVVIDASLDAICLLKRDESDVGLTKRPHMAAIVALLAETFALQVCPTRDPAWRLDAIMQLVKHVPVYDLHYPSTFGIAEDIASCLMDTVDIVDVGEPAMMLEGA